MAAAADRQQGRAIVDLHCHTSASFDSLSDPIAVVRAAAARGITHLAITDHDRVDGAQRAREVSTATLGRVYERLGFLPASP